MINPKVGDYVYLVGWHPTITYCGKVIDIEAVVYTVRRAPSDPMVIRPGDENWIVDPMENLKRMTKAQAALYIITGEPPEDALRKG